MVPKLPDAWLKQMTDHAEREYPRECCGVILGSQKNPDQLIRLIPCQNSADELHAQDPATFRRTASQAYWINPKDLFNIHKMMCETGTCLRVIYHSHIDHPSQFSLEDARIALFEGAPVYPGVCYAVFSVQKGKGVDLSWYDWDELKKSYERQSHVLLDRTQ